METVKIPGEKINNENEENPLEYMIFVWNGKKSGWLLKVINNRCILSDFNVEYDIGKGL